MNEVSETWIERINKAILLLLLLVVVVLILKTFVKRRIFGTSPCVGGYTRYNKGYGICNCNYQNK